MLNNRRQIILRALIEEYIANAVPVGSRTIADNYDLDVSSATIRNDLSALEESGYVAQPHTSAGRVPTDAGYREFVDELLDDSNLYFETSEYDETISRIRQSANEIDEMLRVISNEIASLTDCLACVFQESNDKLRVEKRGITNLMQQPEFISTSDLLPIMEILEDDTVLFKVVEDGTESSHLRVKIGHENKQDNLKGTSLVSTTFGSGEDAGIIAVIGPTRMNYIEVLQAVRAAQNMLNNSVF